MKKLICSTLVATALGFSLSCQAAELPGKGVTLKPARATWTTGFFHEAIVREGLKELGYKVKKPKDLSVPIFYKSVTLGDVDYWTNGWFPMHDAQLPKNFNEKAEKVGYVVKAGGLQGYMVSKKHADQFGITSLADFKRPEVRKAFDKDGDGKVELVPGQPGWASHEITKYHMKEYGLEDVVEQTSASYEAAMAGTYAEFKNGDPVLFYTWSPNWTIFKMKPGIDTVWINVPETKPTEAQAPFAERMEVEGVEGAVSEVLKAGFVVSDVQVVANKKFLAKNPAAGKFLELFHISLADISEQNTKMNEGEKSNKDIERHAKEWIATHQDDWKMWISEAKKAAE